MNLAAEYSRQFGWRPWAEILSSLPGLDGKTVLDLGCGVGDQAAELAKRGARVIGVDLNEELLAVARSRAIPNAEFRCGDMRTLDEVGIVDGIWCSFGAAYVPQLAPTLASWRQHLTPQGWVALTEVDDLFGHEPVEPQTSSILAAHAEDTLAAGRYDFHMGRKLRTHLERAGFGVTESRTFVDKELSFDGPADSRVIEAWRLRFERMKGLQHFCGAMFEHVRDDFLSSLSRADHHCAAKVCFCVGSLPEVSVLSG